MRDLIPFDLERAKKGVPMITRSRKGAKLIAHLQGGQPAPLVVDLTYWRGGVKFEQIENYYIDGRHGTVHDSDLDLFMEY
jgi:hypothetical protein